MSVQVHEGFSRAYDSAGALGGRRSGGALGRHEALSLCLVGWVVSSPFLQSLGSWLAAFLERMETSEYSDYSELSQNGGFDFTSGPLFNEVFFLCHIRRDCVSNLYMDQTRTPL